MKSRSRGKAKVGRSSVRRGEIRWYTFALPDKRRPVLLLSRDAVLLARKERLGATIVSSAESRWNEVERALLIACGFAPST